MYLSSFLARACSFFLTAVPLVSIPGADKTPDSPAAPNTDYVVFLGLNVSVDDNGKLHAVVGGNERDVLTNRNGAIVSTRRRDTTLIAKMEPKLSRRGVSLEAITGAPVHSPATDPLAESQSQMIAMQNIDADRMESAEQAFRQAENAAYGAIAQAAAMPADSPDRGGAEARAGAAWAQATAAADQVAAVVANPQFGEFMPGAGNGGAGHDGYEVTFRISSSEPRSDAYGVMRLVLQYDAQPTAPRQQLLKLFRLRAVDATRRKVIVRALGLPPGAKVESFEVHVYVDGEELATNTSRNRVEITADEAHQFLVLRHLQRHRGETLPAQVADPLRSNVPALVAEHAAALVTLGIDAAGKVSGVIVGSIAAERLPAEIESAVQGARLLPALVDGQPVASTGTFALSELFR